MMNAVYSVAILGEGPVAELLGQRITQHTSLTLAKSRSDSDLLTDGTHCVIYLPNSDELGDGKAAERICVLLKAGVNVVSNAPLQALDAADILSACREGNSSFHGSGGFQNRLISRFNRAFSTITRNISDIQLIEELDVEDLPEKSGRAQDDNKQIKALANAVEGFYEAGLHTLSDAVFSSERGSKTEKMQMSVTRAPADTGLQRKNNKEAAERIIVKRNLGKHLAYDSVWSRRSGNEVPLQYRLITTSSDATGRVTLSFHSDGKLHPVDHLTCTGLLDAVIPVCESKAGILHHDLDINHVMPDDRLV